MVYLSTQQDWEFPPELQRRITERVRPIVANNQIRLRTPVPGGPSGGPGIDHHRFMAELKAARQTVIDKWNKENP
jgi:hypothetical protein